MLVLAAPGPAAAYRCGSTQPDVAQATALTRDNCRAQARTTPPARVNKRGSVSGLTVFVLAVAAVLLIPIGARGRVPSSIDPYSDERSF